MDQKSLVIEQIVAGDEFARTPPKRGDATVITILPEKLTDSKVY